MTLRRLLLPALVVSLGGCSPTPDIACDAPEVATAVRKTLVESTVSADRREQAALSDSLLSGYARLSEATLASPVSESGSELNCQAVLVITPPATGKEAPATVDTVVPLRYQVSVNDQGQQTTRLTAPSSKEVLAITLGLNAIYRARVDGSLAP